MADPPTWGVACESMEQNMDEIATILHVDMDAFFCLGRDKR